MLKKALTVFLVMAFVAALLALPERFAAAVSEGVNLCLSAVVPSLFLFLCAAELIRRLRLFDGLSRRGGALLRYLHLPPSVMPCLLLGLVCGFPVGAREICAARRERRLSVKQAAYALPLCAGASPAFLGALIGQRLFGKASLGLVLWGLSLLCSLLVNALLCRRALAGEPTQRYTPVGDELPPLFPTLLTAVGQAARTLFSVCALIVFFSSVSSVLAGLLPPLPEALTALVLGLIEMTSGVTQLSMPSAVAAALCAGLTAFGGISVTAQTMLFAKAAAVPIRPYLWGRLLAAGLSAALSFFVFFLLSGTY